MFSDQKNTPLTPNSAMQINSKSFNNYLSARERAATQAKLYAEKMNKIALEKVKR